MGNKEKEQRVLVVGELNMDLILNGLNSFPELGKEIFAPEMSLTLGSSSAIFAGNLAMLGPAVSFVGKIGQDKMGTMVLDSLKRKGVDVEGVSLSDSRKTGMTIAFSYQNERAMITYPGAILELSEEDVSDELLQTHQHLHVSSIFMQPKLKEGIVRLFERGKEAGLTTSLDTQWDPEEKWDCHWKELLPLVDIFMPNLEEIKNIAGEATPEDSIRKMATHANTIVVKDGEHGSIGWRDGTFYRQPAFLNEQVEDTIGAGDSFNAGFIRRFLQNRSIEDCLEFGALCGAVNTCSSGGTTAFESKEKIKDIAFKKFNYKIHDL